MMMVAMMTKSWRDLQISILKLKKAHDYTMYCSSDGMGRRYWDEELREEIDL